MKGLNWKEFWEFFIINYPQYLIFMIEIVFSLLMVLDLVFNDKAAKKESFIMPIMFLFFVTIVLIVRRDNDYGLRKSLEVWETYSLLKFLGNLLLFIIFSAGAIVLFGEYTFNYLSYDFIYWIGFIILIMEFIIVCGRVSPILLAIISTGAMTISALIGFNKGIITWSVLSFILLTVGLNLFDKNILRKNFGEISEETIAEKKLSYVMGVLLLFIWLLLSDILSNTDTYKLMMLNQSLLIEKLFLNMLLKLVVLTSVLLFAMNLLLVDNREIIIFSILSKVFRKQVSPLDGDYLMAEYNKKTEKWDIPIKKVRLIEDNGVVKVVRNNSSEEVAISDMKRNLSDVIEIKKEYYIRFDSPKRFTIGGKAQEVGFSMLGKKLKLMRWLQFLTVAILSLFFCYVHSQVNKLNDTYMGFQGDKESQTIDFSKEVNIKNNNITYMGEFDSIDLDSFTFNNGLFKLTKLDDSGVVIQNTMTDKLELFVRQNSSLYYDILSETEKRNESILRQDRLKQINETKVNK